jgi:ABC-type transport system involved in multi-copper enzyme maturation permease subunit
MEMVKQKIRNSALNSIKLVWELFQLNLKIIFANKFFLFLLAAFLFFIFVTLIILFGSDANPTDESVYYLLLFPGILLIAYPTIFGIQNDVDSRTLEVLFGIPNYRYKVWLVRFVFIYIIVFMLMFVLGALSYVAITYFSIFRMTYQLMFPIFFLGSVAFMFSTIIRNGYGTAVVMVVIGLFFWIMSGDLQESKWNLFLNPFHVPANVSEIVWADIMMKNRIYLVVGTVLSLLWGLLNLQKREKFVS